MPESTKIIENGFVVTGDNANRAGKFSILVRGDRIAEVSTRGDLFKSLHPGAEVVDASSKVVFPGFIDAHVHGESFLLRRLTAGVPMARWMRDPAIRQGMSYFREQASGQDLSAAYRLAFTAALKSGVTTLSEFGLDRLDVSLNAALDAFRTAEVRGWVGLHNGDQIDRVRILKNSSIRSAIPIPLEEELTTYNLQSAIRMARELQFPLMIHLGETRAGLETIKKNFRKSIVQFLDEYKVFGLPIHLIHMAALEPEDLDILAARKATLIISPRAILQKHTESPPFEELFKHNIPLALASDWGVPDPFENMRAMIATLQSLRMTSIPPSAVLAMHTRLAANALGIGTDCGTIEPGKKADLAFIDVRDHRLNGGPTAAFEAHLGLLLQELTGRDVSDVMVNGEFFVRQHQLMTYAEEDLQRDQHSLLETLLKPLAVPLRQGPVLMTSAPVIPLIPRATEESEDGDDASEGFRIVRRENKGPADRTNVKPKEQPIQEPLPKQNVRKVFGDDDDPS